MRTTSFNVQHLPQAERAGENLFKYTSHLYCSVSKRYRKLCSSSKVKQPFQTHCADVQALIKIHPQHFLQIKGSFLDLASFSIKSILRMRETAQKARRKRARCV